MWQPDHPDVLNFNAGFSPGFMLYGFMALLLYGFIALSFYCFFPISLRSHRALRFMLL